MTVVIIGSIVLGLGIVLLGIVAGSQLADAFEDYVPPSDAPVQAQEQTDEHDLR